MKTEVLKEAERLFNLGLGVHWIAPKSKSPVKAGWTSGVRDNWNVLKAEYRPGYNLGVRLGRASKMPDGTYLSAMDGDIKSANPKHVKEMLKKAQDTRILETAPSVLSGRGNGSFHRYIRTKEPISGFKFAQSGEKVKVHMPSALKISQYEKQTLTNDEIKAGFRLRPAWEISIMGEGQQIVLPPSIHPDSGKPYFWKNEFKAHKDLPLFIPATLAKKDDLGEFDIIQDFKAVDVDLFTSRLPEDIANLIMGGEDCTDRSAGLFKAAIAMCRCGFSDIEIMSVLTDRDNFLGEAAYQHAQTQSRERAAKWIQKYTIRRARVESDFSREFEKIEAVSNLTRDNALLDFPDEGEDWKCDLERGGQDGHGRVKQTVKNTLLILKNAVTPDFVKYDTFAHTVTYSVNTPWGGKKGNRIRDIDMIMVKCWLTHTFNYEPNTALILEAVQAVAEENSFHPVKDYLRGLKWDGKARLDTWLKYYMGASGDEKYLTAVSRKTLVAMISRIHAPGCQFDNVLIMEGRQGCGKSTAVKIISHPWGSDAFINVGDKDAVLALQSKWVMELGELSAMRKAEVDTLKQFVTQKIDEIRLPYGRLTESFPRQCIFIGTTNSDEYLKDDTGNRRFWPVRVSQCKFAELERDRDQLLAEAQFVYELGECLALDKEVEELAYQEQTKRIFSDSLEEQISDFLSVEQSHFDTKNFRLSDLINPNNGPFVGIKNTTAEQMRVSKILKKLGYEKKIKWTNGRQFKFWGLKMEK